LIRKEHFWSGLKGGIFDEKHYRAMGMAVYLFGWLTTRQTGINDVGEGIVNYGNPMTREKIASDTGYSVRNVKLWTAKLIAARYIRSVPVAKSGNSYFIYKAKMKAKDPKPSTKYFPVHLNPSGHYSVRQIRLTRWKTRLFRRSLILLLQKVFLITTIHRSQKALARLLPLFWKKLQSQKQSRELNLSKN